MIIGFEIMQNFDCSADYRFGPMLGEVFGRTRGYVTSTRGLT